MTGPDDSPGDSIERIESEEEDLESGAPVYRIKSYPSDPNLETLHSRWKSGEFIFPDFQRQFVWKPWQASRLIESFLMGFPVPGIFVFVQGRDLGEGSQTQLVIDGQQRLRSIFGFFDGVLPDGKPFRLTGVDQRWEGKRFKDLEYWEQRDLNYSMLRLVYVEQLVPEKAGSSIYQMFERLNADGKALTAQEIRSNSYHGPFNDMLKETNKQPIWRDIFGDPQPDDRMRDIELIARFLALYESASAYAKPMKKFINDYMEIHREESNPEEYQGIFLDSARRVVKSLGKRPFHVRQGINVAVYDATMVAFAMSDSTPADIVERYQSLLANERFVRATTSGTTDDNTVRERLELARRTLFE